ncbi:MAG: hypothetical protein RLZZ127_1080 [Planctomycetota bacterium]|jgi:prepilin-type N-terminal cleavage/methylation domain-containing protein
MRSLSPTQRQGFTLIELLVVISVIAILATLLFPAIGMVRMMANKTKSGNNTKQIVTSMVAYIQESNGAFPAMTARGTAVTAGDERLETIRGFAILSKWSGGDLSGKIFKVPTAESTIITAQATVDWVAKTTSWDTADTTEGMSYAYDWSIPGENGLKTARPIVGDRDPGYWDGKGINVAFGDTHFEFVNAVDGSADTEEETGTNKVAFNVVYKDNADDDLLKNDDSGKARNGDKMNTVGKGSATRAWLK